MERKQKLPMGIENFERIRKDGFYYVDKTRMIRDLLENMALVNLFTRPRRFGKTLNMSMLKYFFQDGTDRMLSDGKALFEGLDIYREKELCDTFMGKFPVVSITLKEAVGGNFTEAKSMLRRVIGKEAMRFQFLLQSDRLTAAERGQFEAFINADQTGAFTMSDELLKDSLQILSQFLQKHYGQKVIILFLSGIVCRKVPADVCACVVSIRFSCRQLPPEFVNVCYPTCKALPCHDIEFYLCHVQPAPMLWGKWISSFLAIQRAS